MDSLVPHPGRCLHSCSYNPLQAALPGARSGASDQLHNPRLPHREFKRQAAATSLQDRVSVPGAPQDASGLLVGALLPGTYHSVHPILTSHRETTTSW